MQTRIHKESREINTTRPFNEPTFLGYCISSQDIKHGVVENCLMINKSITSGISSFRFIDQTLYEFLKQWNIKAPYKQYSDCFDLYSNIVITRDENKYTYNMADYKVHHYECNSRTVFKSLNNIVNTKAASDKITKYSGVREPSYNQLILASLTSLDMGLKILKPYNADRIINLSQNKMFKHCYKLVHPDTRFIK